MMLKKLSYFFSTFLLSAILISLYMPFSASAANAANWKAGRIIDDAVFTNADAMSVDQIQNLLNQRVGTGGYDSVPGQCDSNGIRSAAPYSSQTRAEYATSQGRPTKFTCLKDYYEVPKTSPGPGIPASNYGGAPIPSGAKSAAHLIWDAAQKYDISPKVLLIKIQTESAGPLTTDDWPFHKQYTYAMGAHCPDSGPNGAANCDPNYAGFSIQIAEAASLLRWYLNSMDQPWWTHKRLGNNSILYQNSMPSCGSSVVNITTRATAALYTYTPYQPNAAALADLYGTGDVCSAYGNRNFWRTFTDWFGTTEANDPYAWSLISQESYGNSAMTNPIDTNILAPNQHIHVRIKARNMGFETWKNSGANPVMIGTNNPSNHNSPSCTSSWVACHRPTKLIESTVLPGDIGTFEFDMEVPNNIGTHREDFNLLAEGKAWMKDIGFHWALQAKPPTYNWSYISQGIYADNGYTKPLNQSILAPNTQYYVRLKARNTGNNSWTNVVRLGASSPQDRISAACDPSWVSCNRAANLKETVIAPGEIGTFEFIVKTPSSLGTYKEYFRPVVDGVVWMKDLGAHWNLGVKSQTYAWQYVSQKVYTDNSRTVPNNNLKIQNGQQQYVTLKARNMGNVSWSNNGANPVKLGTTNSVDRMSSFCDTSWTSCNRAATLKETTIAPGEIGTFEFTVKAPYSTDNFTAKESFNLLSEGKSWMNNLGLYFPFTFDSPQDVWQYVSQSSFSDSARTQTVNTSSVPNNTTYYLRLKAKNTSGNIWQKSKTKLGTSSPQDRTSLFCNPTWTSCNRAGLLKESSVAPGQTGTFEFQVKTPSTDGNYQEYFRPLVEGEYWMSDVGLYWNFGVN